MSHPFEMPIVGRKEFPSHKVSKEELLAYWEKVRRATGMKITEGCRFEDLENRDSSFFIKTNLGEFRSKKVILATGVRGSPRKLGVPGEEQSKVTYNLIDPEQYQGKAVVVVGGGNAGVEAAQMLGDPKWKNQVKLLVRGNDFDRCNEENRIKVTEMHKKGYLEICFSSVVQEIEAKQIIIKRKDESETLPNDFVFIFAGAEMPHKFLMSLGVKIDKKFGEGLKPAS